jgi:hypothetical protein
MQKIKKYTLVDGVNTPTLPAAVAPTVGNDVVTLDYLQANYAADTEWANSVDNITQLKAIGAVERADQQVVAVEDMRLLYQFESGSSETADDYFVVQPTTGTGRWFSLVNRWKDFASAFFLKIKNSSTLTADRILTVNVNDADRTLSLLGNLTVSSAASVAGTNTGDQTISLTGDVTGSGTGSFSAIIPNNTVTNAKQADMAANTIKGNNTGSPADPIDLTTAQTTAMLNNFVGDSGSGGVKGLVPAPASGDAALGKFLKSDGTWAVPSGGGGGGSGSGGGTDLESQQVQDELDSITYSPVNQIMDDFGDEDKGSKTNCLQSNSLLIPSASNLAWNYSRLKEVFNTCDSVSAYFPFSFQALAPKATTISANTIKFNDDVTNMFEVGKKVLITKIVTTDGKDEEIPLRTSSNKVAMNLTVNSVSYSGGETTLVLNNPSGLDLDFTMSAAQYPTNLRVRPFDFTAEIRSDSLQSWETLEYDNFRRIHNVRLNGENYFRELTGLTGSVLKYDGRMSPNQQYGIIRVLENVSSNDLWHWFYTVDGGTTWPKFSTTKSINSTGYTEELDGSTGQVKDHSRQIVVGDNGKWFSTYRFVNGGGNNGLKAVYGELTGTPSINDTPDNTGRLGANFGVGIVINDNANHFYCKEVAASENLDFIVVHYNNQIIANGFEKYLTGGSSFGSTPGGISQNSSPGWSSETFVSGNTPNCKIHVVHKNDADNGVYYLRFPQVSLTADTTINLFASAQVYGAQMDSARDRIAVLAQDTSNIMRLYDITTVHSGTPSSAQKGWNGNESTFNSESTRGSSNGVIENIRKTLGKSIYLDPADAKHQFHVQDFNHSDNIRRVAIAEIRDISTFVGGHISNYTNNTSLWLRDDVARTQNGQTFTANSNAVRSIGFRLYQNAKIDEGYTITAKIYSAPGHVPTGAALYESTNSFNPARLTTSTSGQWVWFNFDGISLTNGNIYYVEVSATYPIHATKHLRFLGNSTSVYAGGSATRYNGSSWVNEVYDFVFEIRDNWMHQPGYDLALDTTISNIATEWFTNEGMLDKNDSSTARYSFRRLHNLTAGNRPYNGHPYSGLISISGSSSVASTLSAPAISSYDSLQFDPNVAFSVVPGLSDCSAIDVLTGVEDTVKKAEDRGGRGFVIGAYTGIVAGDWTTDVNFHQSRCITLNGSSKAIGWQNMTGLTNLQNDRGFMIIGQFLTNSLTTNQAVFGNYNPGASYGWLVQLATGGSSGQIQFFMMNSGGSIVGEAKSTTGTFSIGVVYTYKIVYDGDGTAPRMYLSTAGVDGPFSEVSYATQTPVTGSTTGSGYMSLGAHSQNTAAWFNGKLGYHKILRFIKGVTPAQVTNSFFNQAPITHAQNLGVKMISERRVGESSSTAGVHFDKLVVIDSTPSTASMVSSYDFALYNEGQNIAGTPGTELGLQLTIGRKSTRDASALRGLNVKFNREVI